LLTIKSNDSIWTVTVKNPWQKSVDTEIQYLFSESHKCENCIHIPVKKVICFSSSHVAMISALGKQESIKGISGLKYICDSTVNVLAGNGNIIETGYEDNLNYELLIKEKPDVALIYGVGTEHARYISRLEELGIQVIYVAEYLENHPLGRLEWIKLFGILFNEYNKAESIFNIKAGIYDSLCKISYNNQNRPVVFSGSPIGDNWYVPGGISFMANLIKDAGGNYIFAENKQNESFTISLETAYKNLFVSDIWINCDIPSSVLYSDGSRYLNIPPAKMKNVYSNNNIINKSGGNDFWESAVVFPELLLKDLINIIDTKSDTNYNFKYYRNL